MLLTSAARALYDTTSKRWAKLEAWYKAPGNPGYTHLRQLDKLIAHWHEIDSGGFTTDTDDLDGSYKDLETAESYAHDYGFTLPPDYRGRTTSVVDLQPLTKPAQAVENAIPKGGFIDNLTSPKDKPICDRLGTPKAFCGKDGFGFYPKEVPWWVWALGATYVGGVGILAYVGYRAAPYVIPVVAPELQVAVEGVRAARASGDKAEVGLAMKRAFDEAKKVAVGRQSS